MAGDDDCAMFHHLFFVMSLSGSFVILLYKLTYPIARRYFSHSWRKKILCLSLFFYLVPLSLLKEFVLSQLNIDLPFQYENVRIDLKYTINVQNDQFFLGPGVVAAYIVLLCMAMIAVVVIIKQLKKYGAVYRTYFSRAFHEAPPPQLESMLRQTKEELLIKRPVKLICSKLCDAPMTIGVFKPAIVFPSSDKLNLKSDDNKFILKHELLHIKNGDLLLKFLTLFALAVHWYNPICHLLYYELCAVSEINCDHGVLKGANDAQRQQYSHLILNLAAAGGGRKERFAVGLVKNDAATFERRILEMKKTSKKTKPMLSCIMMLLIFVMGTITAFAYEAPQKYMSSDFNWESEYTISIADDAEDVERFQFDYFFTDTDGHVTPLNNPSPKILCKHNYVEGQATKHAKKTNGGCTVTIRSAKICTLCNLVIEGGVISETTYTVCPH